VQHTVVDNLRCICLLHCAAATAAQRCNGGGGGARLPHALLPSSLEPVSRCIVGSHPAEMWTSLTSLAAKAQAVVKSVEQSVDSAMEAVDAPPAPPGHASSSARSASSPDIAAAAAEAARLRKRVVELEEEVNMRDAKIAALEHLRAHPATPRRRGDGGDCEGDGGAAAPGGAAGSAADSGIAKAGDRDAEIAAVKAAAEAAVEKSKRDGEWWEVSC
jgi:hypothetical protein